VSSARLLAGRDIASGAETLAEHVRRLGPLPSPGRSLIDLLIQVGLTGRGGAAFPVGLKWKSVATHSHGTAVIIANGAEGEPHSMKDRLLMSARPHLALDGAFLAAKALRAKQIVLYIGEPHHAARHAMSRALDERTSDERRMVSIFAAPGRYVAGESSATAHLINQGVATPTTTPPSTHERGVAAGPTLVQTVETLAHVALIARTGRAAETLLVTMAGGVARSGVLEVEVGTRLRDAVHRAGGTPENARAFLVGGYFGQWVEASAALDLPLDPVALRERGISLGCGVIGALPETRCPVCEVAGIMRYLAGESSAQCGPCFFGLRALAFACTRIADHGSDPFELNRLERWSAEVRGRGACKHPDGAVLFLQSALKTFGDDFAHHPAHVRRSA
jgi:NADH:ubiquinone oxidoreductase subunit F (NADH-binding)